MNHRTKSTHYSASIAWALLATSFVGVLAAADDDATAEALERARAIAEDRIVEQAAQVQAEVIERLDIQVDFADPFEADAAADDVEVKKRIAAEREKQMTATLENQRKSDQTQFDLVIEDMQRVSGLDDGQVKKLSIAAKGAIDRRLDDRKKQMEKIQERLGDQLGIQLAGRPGAAVEFIVAAEAGMLQANSRGASGGAVSSQVWKKAVDKVMTTDQKNTYEKARAERSQRRREVQIQTFIADLDDQLLLTEEQRTEIYKSLMPGNNNDARSAISANALARNRGVTILQEINNGQVVTETMVGGGNVTFAPNRKQRDKIAKLMTEKQAEVWKSSNNRVPQNNGWLPVPAAAAPPVELRLEAN